MSARGSELRIAAATPRDAVDGAVPEEIVTPTEPGEVAEALRTARELGKAVIVRGGGTRIDLGNPPSRFDRLISLADLTGGIEHDPDDMVVSVNAGTSLDSLERSLATHGQRSGLGAWQPQRATVGGIVSVNEHGTRSYAYGGPRDQVLGLEVIDGTGRSLRCGGRVVKNVAGYDLPRLFTGSLGTLAIITKITLRTHPLPEMSRELEIRAPEMGALTAACASLFRSRLPLSALLVQGRADPERASWSILLEIAGTETQVCSMAAAIPATADLQAGEASVGVIANSLPGMNENLVLRAVVPPAVATRTAADWLESVRRQVPSSRVTIDFPGAVVRLMVTAPAHDKAIRLIDQGANLVRGIGASLVIERAPLEAKAGRDVWGAPPGGLEIMRRVKARFDPDHVLAPGRFVAGI